MYVGRVKRTTRGGFRPLIENIKGGLIIQGEAMSTKAKALKVLKALGDGYGTNFSIGEDCSAQHQWKNGPGYEKPEKPKG